MKDLHYPIYLLVRDANEYATVTINEEMNDCIAIFTHKELAELYLAEEGSGMNLEPFDFDEFAKKIQQLTPHGIKNYALNFTLKATSVKCGHLTELLL